MGGWGGGEEDEVMGRTLGKNGVVEYFRDIVVNTFLISQQETKKKKKLL